MIIEINTTTDGVISFYVKTSTKYKKDYLIFYLDGKSVKNWSGEVDWTHFEVEIDAGYHKLEWRYDTAPQGGTEGNVCWVDDIIFPGNTLIMDDVDEVEILGGRPVRTPALVAVRVHPYRQSKLLEVVPAAGPFRRFLHLAQRGQEHPRQDRDDGDHHQKLDQRKPLQV